MPFIGYRKKVSNWFYVLVVLSLEFFPTTKKLGLDLQNEYVIVNNGCSTHQTSDWSLVDWRELSKSDIEYLNDLAEKSEVS